ncbi:MAG: carbohydrate kinase [Novosphingobium sp.]|nr:carbohydrate kinase [Novosphingobium sp.]
MTGQGATIVVDIGKTLSKVTLWTSEGELLDRRVRRNEVRGVNGMRLLDTAATCDWLIETMTSFAGHPVTHIVPVAHGAAIAGLHGGALAFASPDYEAEMPADVEARYRAQRDPFTLTGSPALPAGLNLGAQLFWLEHLAPGQFGEATLLPYAQYWAWLLTGKAVSEVTSLGCHSDLWNPTAGNFSPMAVRRGWAGRFAPLASAGDVVGTLKPELAALTGLSPQVKVHAGIHDSNAALMAARGYPEIADNEATVLSTGTWFIAMRLPANGAATVDLPESRDCLVNVDAYGHPVPSARFMGGREIETLIELDTRQVDIKPDQPVLLASVQGLLDAKAMVLPTLAPGCGPFPNGEGRWVNRPDDWTARRAGASLYAALMADTALELIGSRDTLLVEGRFAEAEVFVRALASLRPETNVYVANAHNDVSFGALRLIDPSLRPQGSLRRIAPLAEDLTDYAAMWREKAGEAERHRS